MTFPIQVALIGVAAVFTLYLIFRDQSNNRRQLISSSGGGDCSGDPYSSYIPYETYDTPIHRRNSEATNKDCMVCLFPLEEASTSGNMHRALQCGHVFHGACIEKWLLLKRDCPICRNKA